MFKLNVSLFALTVLTSITSGCSTAATHASRSTASDSSGTVYAESQIEKAKQSEAIRDFDQAIIHYEYALTNGAWADEHPQRWMIGLRDMVSLAVHVKNNPSLAVELVSEISAAKSVPTSLAAELNEMKQSLKGTLREDLKEDRIERKAAGKVSYSGDSPFNGE
jgi:hypothetical protein